MKVLIAYHYFPVYRAPVLRALRESDALDVDLLWGESTGRVRIRTLNSAEMLDLGFASCSLHVARNIWVGSAFLWQTLIISRALFKRYDVILLLGDYRIGSYWIAMLFARVTRRKVLLWTHGILRAEYGLKAIIRRRFYALSDGLLLYGRRAKQLLRNGGLDSLPMWVVGNSLDYEAAKKYRVPPTAADLSSPRRIVYIGRLEGGKHLDLLLEACAISRDAVALDIIGDGSARSALEAQAEELELQNVTFHGALFDETVIAPYLNRASAAVIPGDAGLSVIHALSYGLPVITHDNFDRHKPEVETIVGTRVGIFYDYGNAVDLAKRLVQPSPSRYDSYDNCIKIVENDFTPKAQAGAITRALWEAADK